MTTMMMKMMMPTTILSPATNFANDDTTCPAAFSPSLPGARQNQPRRGDVQHQPGQRRGQQQRRENAELQRLRT